MSDSRTLFDSSIVHPHGRLRVTGLDLPRFDGSTAVIEVLGHAYFEIINPQARLSANAAAYRATIHRRGQEFLPANEEFSNPEEDVVLFRGIISIYTAFPVEPYDTSSSTVIPDPEVKQWPHEITTGRIQFAVPWREDTIDEIFREAIAGEAKSEDDELTLIKQLRNGYRNIKAAERSEQLRRQHRSYRSGQIDGGRSGFPYS